MALHRVAQLRPRAVALHVLDLPGGHPGVPQGPGDGLLHRRHRRGGQGAGAAADRRRTVGSKRVALLIVLFLRPLFVAPLAGRHIVPSGRIRTPLHVAKPFKTTSLR